MAKQITNVNLYKGNYKGKWINYLCISHDCNDMVQTCLDSFSVSLMSSDSDISTVNICIICHGLWHRSYKWICFVMHSNSLAVIEFSRMQ